MVPVRFWYVKDSTRSIVVNSSFRTVSGQAMTDATDAENDSLDDIVERPSLLSDFAGQEALRENLSVYINSARRMAIPLDHVLLHGPPGLGKTTIARIIANELGVGFRVVAAPAVGKPADLVSTLVALEERDVLFIDEIHRLPAPVEEVLYPVMEDFRLDLIVGDVGQAKAVSVPLPRFTLVGATTRLGSLTGPLRDRFGIDFRLEYYDDAEMTRVLARAADRLRLSIEGEAVSEIARRSRGTPRVGLRLIRRVRDFAVSSNIEKVTWALADEILTRIGVDRNGLNEWDRRYLDCIKTRFRGGPVGLSTLAAALGDSPDMIEHALEPYLIRKGLLDRTPRGRITVQAGD